MNIQVVGGSGFIGSYLIKSLEKKGNPVLNIDKSNIKSGATEDKMVNILDKGALINAVNNAQIAEWVVLLAAEHKDDVTPISLYYDVNVVGTQNVLDAMDNRGIKKIIFTSSVAVYGLNKVNPDESFPVDPFNDYGKSKWEAEEVLRKWYQKDPENRTLIIIRPTVVFGPGNRGNVYNLLKQIASGKFMMIGKGINRKSMAFVENVTGFIEFCINNITQGYHIFNYADKPDLTTKELIQQAEVSLKSKIAPIQIPYWIGYMGGGALDLIGKVIGRKFSISAVRVKKFCATTQFSSEKVLKTGYKGPYSLKEGLDKTIKGLMED